MKEKDKKTISIVCLIAGFIITLFVVQLIYTLTLRQWLDHKTAKAFLNIGWDILLYVCLLQTEQTLYFVVELAKKKKQRIIKT